MRRSDYVEWLSAVMTAARDAGVQHLDLSTSQGRVRFSNHRPVPRHPTRVERHGFEDQLQLAEWFETGRLCVVRSLSVGIWTASRRPGDQVSPGDPLGEIRSVGLTNTVRSPIKGFVTANYTESAHAVEYGQLLVSLLRT